MTHSFGAEARTSGLRVLIVDDEEPARADLEFLLKNQPSVSEVDIACDATQALRLLQAGRYDGVFLDIRMPGLDGLEMGRLLLRFADPPVVIYVTAYEAHAVQAFEARARGYLLKPVSSERLADALAVIAEARRPIKDSNPADDDGVRRVVNDLSTVPVESGGRVAMVDRADVCWVQANGDYVRLHTVQGGSHLVRLPLGLFEQRWAEHGFVRIHRSYLVAIRHVVEVRTGSAGESVVRVAGHDLTVSRRHTAELKHRLLRVSLVGRPQ